MHVRSPHQLSALPSPPCIACPLVRDITPITLLHPSSHIPATSHLCTHSRPYLAHTLVPHCTMPLTCATLHLVSKPHPSPCITATKLTVPLSYLPHHPHPIFHTALVLSLTLPLSSLPHHTHPLFFTMLVLSSVLWLSSLPCHTHPLFSAATKWCHIWSPSALKVCSLVPPPPDDPTWCLCQH